MAGLNGCRTTRIYCRENCPPGRRTRPENRVHFPTEAAAIAAGYRACKVCKPDVFEGPWRPRQAVDAAGTQARAGRREGEAISGGAVSHTGC
jgi:AraC family transcriptional regulator of adaptative response / DNA-3-methyladenine glycosylase II